MRLIFLSLFLLSCSTFEFDNWNITYPPELNPQIQLWREYAPEDIKYKKLRIILVKDLRLSNGKKVSGVSSKKDHVIKLDPNSDLYKYSRTMLVLHELGHFVLDRDHNDKLFTDAIWNTIPSGKNFPISLMTSKANIPMDIHLENPIILDYYMNELFNY